MTGRLFDEHGNRLTPVHATSHGKRYRYYVTDTRRASAKDAEVWRIPAATIEPIVQAQLIQLLRNKAQLTAWIQEYRPALSLTKTLENAATLYQRVAADGAGVLAVSIIGALIHRVTFSAERIRYDINVGELLDSITRYEWRPNTNGIARTTSKPNQSESVASPDQLAQCVAITQPIMLKRRGFEMRIVLDNGAAVSQALDQTLIDAVVKAHLALMKLTDRSTRSIAVVAEELNMDASDLSRMLPLAFLPPKITDAILTGRHSPDLTLRTLTRGAELPMLWTAQAE